MIEFKIINPHLGIVTLFTLFIFSLLTGCSGKKIAPQGIGGKPNRDIGFIEFKLNNVTYRVEADSISSSASFSKKYINHLSTNYGSEYPPQASSLGFKLENTDTMVAKKYVVRRDIDVGTRDLSFVYVGKGITLSGSNLDGDGEIAFTRLDRNLKGVVEGTFSIKNVTIQQGNTVISRIGAITDGKFKIRLDWK